MSTVTLTYPDAIPVRRVASVRSIILIIAISALIAGAVLVISFSAAINSSSDASPSGVVAVVVPPAPAIDTQVLPVESATPAPGPDVIAVPVPMPPSE
jgi:hypothetical protein